MWQTERGSGLLFDRNHLPESTEPQRLALGADLYAIDLSLSKSTGRAPWRWPALGAKLGASVRDVRHGRSTMGRLAWSSPAGFL